MINLRAAGSLAVAVAVMAIPLHAEIPASDPTSHKTSTFPAVITSVPVESSTPIYHLFYESPRFDNFSNSRIQVWESSDPINGLQLYRIKVLDQDGAITDELFFSPPNPPVIEAWVWQTDQRPTLYLRYSHFSFFRPTYLFEMDNALKLKESGIFLEKSELESFEADRALRIKKAVERERLYREKREKESVVNP